MNSLTAEKVAELKRLYEAHRAASKAYAANRSLANHEEACSAQEDYCSALYEAGPALLAALSSPPVPAPAGGVGEREKMARVIDPEAFADPTLRPRREIAMRKAIVIAALTPASTEAPAEGAGPNPAGEELRAFQLGGPVDPQTGAGMWALDTAHPPIRPVARCLSKSDALRLAALSAPSPAGVGELVEALEKAGDEQGLRKLVREHEQAALDITERIARMCGDCDACMGSGREPGDEEYGCAACEGTGRAARALAGEGA